MQFSSPETIIMNILRGSGTKGLVGIEKMKDNKYIRPLLEVSREEIEELISELPNLNRINLNHRNMLEDILELLEELTEFNKELVDGLDYFNKAYELEPNNEISL